MKIIKKGTIEIPAKVKLPHKDMERLRAELRDLEDGEAILVHGLEYHRVNSVCTLIRHDTGDKFALRTCSKSRGIYVWKNPE